MPSIRQAAPLSHKDEEWFLYGGECSTGDVSVIRTVPSVPHSVDFMPESEVLGISEWIRTKDGDLALMTAAPLGYRLAAMVLRYKDSIGIPDLVAQAEAFMKKIVESMDKLGTTVYNDIDPLGPKWDEFAEAEK